jgi:hypothetical protein
MGPIVNRIQYVEFIDRKTVPPQEFQNLSFFHQSLPRTLVSFVRENDDSVLVARFVLRTLNSMREQTLYLSEIWLLDHRLRFAAGPRDPTGKFQL